MTRPPGIATAQGKMRREGLVVADGSNSLVGSLEKLLMRKDARQAEQEVLACSDKL